MSDFLKMRVTADPYEQRPKHCLCWLHRGWIPTQFYIYIYIYRDYNKPVYAPLWTNHPVYPNVTGGLCWRCSCDFWSLGSLGDFMILWSIPWGSMYGIFTYIWLIFMGNVGKYTIHGSSGIYTIFHSVYDWFFGGTSPNSCWDIERNFISTLNEWIRDWNSWKVNTPCLLNVMEFLCVYIEKLYGCFKTPLEHTHTRATFTNCWLYLKGFLS